MSTPSEVRELIDRLAGNTYDAYYGSEHSGPAYSGEQGWTAARFLARNLLHKGWRKAGLGALPHCPYGRCHHCNRQGHSRCRWAVGPAEGCLDDLVHVVQYVRRNLQPRHAGGVMPARSTRTW